MPRTNILIIPHHGEDVESILKRLKKGSLKAALFREMKRKDFFEPPSLARRRKSALARKRLLKVFTREGEHREHLASEKRWDGG